MELDRKKVLGPFGSWNQEAQLRRSVLRTKGQLEGRTSEEGGRKEKPSAYKQAGCSSKNQALMVRGPLEGVAEYHLDFDPAISTFS